MGFGHHPFEGDDRVPGPALPPAEWNMGQGKGQAKGKGPRGRIRGVALGLPASGPGSVAQVSIRAYGLILDGLILLPWFLLSYLLRRPHFDTVVRADGRPHRQLHIDRPVWFIALLLALPPALYVIGLIAQRARTIGQQRRGLRVVRLVDVPAIAAAVAGGGDLAATVNAAPTPGWGASAVRWSVLGCVTVLAAFVRLPVGVSTVAALVVYLWAYWDANGQGLHDKAARVVVLQSR